MSRSSPRRRRTFIISATSDGTFAASKFGPRTREAGGLEIGPLHFYGSRVEFGGVYVTHGNGEYDLRQMAARAGLSDARVTTVEVTLDPCGDYACAGCSRHAGPRMVDSWGLASAGIILGGIQAGFELVHRVSRGFFDEAGEANRHLLGDRWRCETTDAADEWTPVSGVSYVAGVPPCSGFSLLNTSNAIAKKHGKEGSANFRGKDSPINACQAEVARYGAKCTGSDGKPGAEIISFESVPGAFTQGRELMVRYLHLVREITGQPYRLYHLLHSDASLGGAQMRSRYLWVAARIPFGVEVPEIDHVATYRDAIGDLAGVSLQEDASAIAGLPPAETEYQEDLRRPRGSMFSETHGFVLGGSAHQNVAMTEIARDVAWEPGEGFVEVYRRYIEKHGQLPRGCGWHYETNTPQGFMGPRRVRFDQPGYVLTGGGGSDFIHPVNDRLLTLREIARLMGAPDDWRVDYNRPNKVAQQLGKNCPTQAGRWVGEAAFAAAEGRPQSVQTAFGPRGEEDEYEVIIDITNKWRKVLKNELEIR